jgi:DNA (cytosine-5)-methyltransferase 1
LGLSRAGHGTSLLCEIDPVARAVLTAHFGEKLLYTDDQGKGDVKSLESLPSGTTFVTAGFPCQDLSQAGRTRGIRGSRSGLVGEVFRLLQDARTPWVLFENVPFMLHLAGGEALHVIIAALEDLRYRWAYRVVDSRSFGLPQRRRRVYLLASQDDDPRTVLFADDAGPVPEPSKENWTAAACGFYWTEGNTGLGWTHDAIPTLKSGSGFGIPSAPAVVLPDGAPGERFGTPTIGDAERLQGFDPGWTAPAALVERDSLRWRLIGNAVTVDAAEWLGWRLRSPGIYNDSNDPIFPAPGRWPLACYNVGDGTRVARSVSEWPLHPGRLELARFLNDAIKPLSLRASEGFYNRFRNSTLDKPKGFLPLLKRHIDAMRTGS